MATTYRTCPRTGLQFDLDADKLMRWNAVAGVLWLLVGGITALLVILTRWPAIKLLPADQFYIITKGQVEILLNQPAGHAISVATMGAGQYFGEIGLLRDVPRTATVTAVEETTLYSLARDDFLDAVRGVDESLAAADDVVMRRLARA